LEAFTSKIAALEQFQREVFVKVIDLSVPYEAEIAQMNTDRLYKLGEYTDGSKIADRKPYRPLTVRLKRAKGQPTNRVTLRDTGDFHGSFYVRFERNKFIVLASDVKTQKLVKKYGHEIFGLTDEDFEKLRGLIYGDLLDEFKRVAYAN